jgi:amidase
LFLDATTTTPAPAGGFVAAAAKNPGRLRIALSTKVPPPLVARIGKEQRAAVDAAGALLRDLGHDVVARDPDYPPAAIYGNFLPRYFRGIYNDVREMPHQDRLEKRTRNMARIGSLIPDGRMVKIRAAESALAERIQSIFQDVDVVITPGNATGPSRIGAYQRLGGIASLLAVSQRVPFFEIWNLTGQPAAAVPWGLDGNGVPLSIQLVGRPNDEATLLSLGTQIETARPWAQRRPPVS